MEGTIEILNVDMKPGDTLKVKGKIPADAVGFSVNLGCSSRDLAFHFNPRFNESVIVCNSKCSDAWQTEHRDRHLSFFRGCTVKVRGLCQHGVMGHVWWVWVCGEYVVRGSPQLAGSHTIVFPVLPDTSCSLTIAPHFLGFWS
uniref:Galectin n=1 Tax=Cyanistes caeruleus TaxID=156563 RepID=A0A8C0UDJ5_CYACU